MAPAKNPWTLPAGWKWGTIADVAEVASNLIQPSAVPHLPHIAPNHIEPGRPWLLPYSTVEKDGVTSPKHRFVPGQILYSKIRPYLRKAVLVDFEGVCSADMYPLNARCEPNYLLWWLLSPAFNELAMEHQGRTVLPKINQQALYRVPIPIPPHSEQRRIVSRIDDAFSRSKSTREELARIPRLIERLRQAVLATAFRGELTADWRYRHDCKPQEGDRARVDARVGDLFSLPSTWAWSGLAAVADVSGGLTKNASHGSRELRIPYLRVANVYANELRLDEVLEIPCTPSERDRTRLRPGDLMIVEGNGSIEQIGRVAIWNGEISECLHQNHLIRVRPRTGLRSKFLLYWLLSTAARNAIERVASSSSGLHTLSISKVGGLPVPVTCGTEMDLIVSQVETAFAAIDRAAAEANRAMDLVDRLDRAILAKAFRGELVGAIGDVVQDGQDFGLG